MSLEIPCKTRGCDGWLVLADNGEEQPCSVCGREEVWLRQEPIRDYLLPEIEALLDLQRQNRRVEWWSRTVTRFVILLCSCLVLLNAYRFIELHGSWGTAFATITNISVVIFLTARCRRF